MLAQTRCSSTTYGVVVSGSSNPDTDAELITAMWVHAREGDVEETRSKLSCFPSSCIRYEGKPVAFEMVSQAGQLTALYVLKEHRGKGLGRIVELDLCQKTIRCDPRIDIGHQVIQVDVTSIL
nr:Protein T10B10.4, isoform a [Haemonchus contortus]